MRKERGVLIFREQSLQCWYLGVMIARYLRTEIVQLFLLFPNGRKLECNLLGGYLFTRWKYVIVAYLCRSSVVLFYCLIGIYCCLCQVKVWCTKQEASAINIDMKANICSVKYNPGSSYFVAVCCLHFLDLYQINVLFSHQMLQYFRSDLLITRSIILICGIQVRLYMFLVGTRKLFRM
jgi:hypothetical protein